MIYRYLANGFLILGIGLLCLAGYCYYLQTDAPGASIDEPDREFPNLAVGENQVRFRVHNPTRHTVRIVGCSFC